MDAKIKSYSRYIDSSIKQGEINKQILRKISVPTTKN